MFNPQRNQEISSEIMPFVLLDPFNSAPVADQPNGLKNRHKNKFKAEHRTVLNVAQSAPIESFDSKKGDVWLSDWTTQDFI